MPFQNCRSLDLPLLPALLAALLCIGASIHQHPTLLRPLLAAAQILPQVR